MIHPNATHEDKSVDWQVWRSIQNASGNGRMSNRAYHMEKESRMSKPAYKTTVLKVSVHPVDDDPVLSDRSTHVSLEDEGGGPFVEIRQSNPAAKTGVVRLDFDELEPVAEAFFALLAGLKK